jgi:hypothetical protein
VNTNYLVEEVESNLEETSIAYANLNPPKIPIHKLEIVILCTLEESIAIRGAVKFWENPLFFMVREQG